MNGYQKVYEAVKRIPKGNAATYGQVAALIGSPRAARQVGFVLSKLPADSKIPWHRVVNSRGMISIENLSVPKQEQARRLQKEGIEVEFRNGNYWVDLDKYQWRAGIV